MKSVVPPFDFQGEAFIPRGINLGSWLNIEDFMLGTPGTEWQVLREYGRFCGQEEAREWHERYLDVFLTEADLRFIRESGFNSVRLPIHWRRIESAGQPGVFLEAGFQRISWLMDAAERIGLAVLLDLHVAPGGQNNTPPADNTWGAALLWQEPCYQDRTVAIWRELAARYGNHPALLGFNLINEPQLDQYGPLDEAEQAAAMNALNLRLLAAIREVAPEAWVVVDAPLPRDSLARNLDAAFFKDPRTAWSYHHYPLAPWDQGINTEWEHPDSGDSEYLVEFLRERIAGEIAFARRVGRPVMLGEFGFHREWNKAWGLAVVEAQIELAEELGFGWMVWSYKDVGVMGLVSPKADTVWQRWLRRPGWEEFCASVMQSVGQHRAALQEKISYNHESARVHDFAFVLDRVAQRSVLNHEFFRQFAAEMTRDERLATAESFALDHCEVDEAYLAVLGSKGMLR